MRTPCRTQSTEKLEDTDRLRRRFRVVGYAFSLLLTVLVLFRLMRSTVALFHWAERRIDRDSPLHMLAFLAVTLPFNLGLPIPVVHQAWSVAIGCFFGWRAFPMLFAMLTIGVPLPFLIGRRLARGDRVAVWLRRSAPGAMSYMTPLRRAVAARPVRSSFLLMWAPLPTSTLPLIAGFLIPPSELPLGGFVSGAFPSKLLHFACDVLVGLEAGSLAAALDDHDEIPGLDEVTDHLSMAGGRRRARRIAVGTMGLTLLFMLGMVHLMHRSLKEMKQEHRAKEESEAEPLRGDAPPSSAARLPV